jgi:hypothetical protein
MITKSKRTRFTASHLTPEAKEALQDVAKQKRMSVSKLIAEAVDEKLERLEGPEQDKE